MIIVTWWDKSELPSLKLYNDDVGGGGGDDGERDDKDYVDVLRPRRGERRAARPREWGEWSSVERSRRAESGSNLGVTWLLVELKFIGYEELLIKRWSWKCVETYQDERRCLDGL